MLSQFVSPYQHRLLGDLDFNFPQGTQAVGRLDEDSEGLLILTTDKTLTKRLLHPDKKHTRSYIVQVQKKVEQATIDRLKNGVEILIKRRGKYITQPCQINLIEKPLYLVERENEMKEFIPHSWLEFILIEGKNRQIRKMCKAVNHNCKRLIRTKIENLHLENMVPGEVRELKKDLLFEKLFGKADLLQPKLV